MQGNQDTGLLALASEQPKMDMLQYTSLILIILTFIVGAFSHPYEGGATQVEPPLVQSEPRFAMKRFAEVEYDDLFESTGVNAADLAALQFVLLQHDIDAEIEVYAGSESHSEAVISEDEFSRAVARSMLLYRKLVEQGVPSDVLRVVVVPQHSKAQAKVTLASLGAS